MSLRAGELRHRITIERVTITQPLGEVTETWATLATRRAKKEATSAGETFGSDQKYAESEFTYTVRYDPTTSGITARDRVVEDTDTYQIDGVADPTGLKEMVQIFVTRINDG